MTSKQTLQRLSVVLAQIKAGYTFENVINEIRQIILNHIFFYIKQKKLLKKYTTI